MGGELPASQSIRGQRPGVPVESGRCRCPDPRAGYRSGVQDHGSVLGRRGRSQTSFRLLLFAGRFLLKDISNPNTTQHTITDATNFSACYAIHAGECRTDSNAGDRYVSVPFAAGENQCLTNQYEEVAPCFFNASPVAGKIQQMDISGSFDQNGARQRMLPTAFTGIGGQYQYSAPKDESGWRMDVRALLVAQRSSFGSLRRLSAALPGGGFSCQILLSCQQDLNVSGTAGDQVRLCWGYAENGPVDGSSNSLYPTSGRSAGVPSDPFQRVPRRTRPAL